MKKILCLTVGLIALNLTPGFAQPATAPSQILTPRILTPRPVMLPRGGISLVDQDNNQSTLTKFNLDFPGGTPIQLVAAIEKAMGKPLNVIVPTDEINSKVTLPAIKVNDMDVPRLFKALEENKLDNQRNDYLKRVAFYTEDAAPSDNSLWKFVYYVKPSTLTMFSLDFHGGSPSLLVKEIEKAMGKPLNVVINKEDENVELPALKMNDVYLPQLFTALETASRKTVIAVSNPNFPGNYSQVSASYGFRTADNSTDTAVWYFHVEKPLIPPLISKPKVCQFFSLTDYLDAGLTVDDITTVIQNGWKMAGVESTPELKYHKETKLLMAYGEPDKMATISDVLKVLKPKDDLTSQMIRQISKEKSERSGSTNSSAEKPGK